LLFWQGVPFRRRLICAGITLVAALALKAGVDLLSGNPSPLFTMTYQVTDLLSKAAYEHQPITGALTFKTSRLAANLREIFVLKIDSPLFINAGLLVALLLLPIKKRPIGMLKVITGVFILGIFLFGVINEYRIWFELIPISLYALDIYFFHLPMEPSMNLIKNR
jgi:hypothetical protein